MARHESEREDLLREATALVERAELMVAGESEPVTVGFRRDGSLSFFFGGDPVYQFNTAGELRRAYADGLLYKAERGRLVSLRRERTENEVGLVRTELADDATAAFLIAAQRRLGRLGKKLVGGKFAIVGMVPPESAIVGRVRDWLFDHPGPLTIALSPRVS